MKSAFGRLARQSGLYALSNILIKASGLLLAPLYLDPSLLTVESFGHLVTLEATAQLAIPLIGLGLATGLVRFLTAPEHEDQHATIPFTTFALIAVLAALAFAALWLLAPVASRAILSGPERADLFRWIGAYIALKVVASVPFMLIRTQERAGLYVVATVAEAALLIGGVYYFLGLHRMGLEGVLRAYVASAGASALVLSGGMLAVVRWRFHLPLAWKLLRFSAPLAIAGIALPILHVGDRYLLEWLSTTEELAVYGWAARLSGVLNMLVVQSFQLAFLVVGLKALGGTGGGALHRRVFRHYTIWAGYVVVGLTLLAYDVTAWISADAVYLAAAPEVFPLSLGYLAYGFYTISVNVMYATSRPGAVAVAVSGGALVNLALNAVLIPPLGGMGAAIATLVAYAFLAVSITRSADQSLDAGFPWRTLATVLVIIVALWAAAQPAYGWSVPARLGWLAALIVAYPVLVRVTGLYSRDEVRTALRWIGERLRTTP